MKLPFQNGTLILFDHTVDYIRFGGGKQKMILLPGLGDGLQTVKGTALPMALGYRSWGKDFTVYALSRRNTLPQGFTTKDMAADVAAAMEALGMEKAHVLGVSMGGMIAQHLAADFPERVEKLVLAVTCPGPNPILEESIEEWVALAKAGDAVGFMKSNLRRIYSEAYCRKNLWLAPIVGKLTKPKSYGRFFIQAEACLGHDARAALQNITAPTLVIGGAQDLALGVSGSEELAAAIPGADLQIYPQWGHGCYEEAEDFQERVKDFCLAD